MYSNRAALPLACAQATEQRSGIAPHNLRSPQPAVLDTYIH
jgi:hypothetical protein